VNDARGSDNCTVFVVPRRHGRISEDGRGDQSQRNKLTHCVLLRFASGLGRIGVWKVMAPTWLERCCTNNLSEPTLALLPSGGLCVFCKWTDRRSTFRCCFHLAIVSIAVLHDDATRALMA
jgi:hypothetical protein